MLNNSVDRGKASRLALLPSSILRKAFWMLLLGLICGCSGYDYAEVQVHPVSGNLTVAGEPAHGAYITFHPTGNVGMSKGNKPFARVQPDGTFTVTTYDSNDGAPVGEYRVTVIWPEDPEARGPSADKLKGRFSQPASTELTVQIDEETSQLPPWNLDG